MRCVLKNSRLTVSVDTMGAELRSVRSEKDGFEYMWQGDAEHWQGTAYHLFPFIGRLQGGKYRYCGNEYYMPLHGFAYTSRFVVGKTTNTAVCMELTDNETTYSQYPFRFLPQGTFPKQFFPGFLFQGEPFWPTVVLQQHFEPY